MMPAQASLDFADAMVLFAAASAAAVLVIYLWRAEFRARRKR
jgi:hypothetical protein